MDLSLHDKVALVTGSSRGIGRVLARDLAGHEATVVIHGTKFDSPQHLGEGESMEQVAGELASETGAVVTASWGDLANENEVARIVREVRERHGRIDILVNCAGGDIGPLGAGAPRAGRPDPDDCLAIAVPDIRSVLDRNLMTCILCCREVGPEMVTRKSGRIINIGSTAGTYGRDNGAIYAVAKAAVHHYTRCLAAQLRPHNVTVNCVAPGGTVTPRFLAIHQVDEEMMVEEGTLARYGRPREIAALVTFLASGAAQYLSGQIIRADGGQFAFAA